MTVVAGCVRAIYSIRRVLWWYHFQVRCRTVYQATRCFYHWSESHSAARRIMSIKNSNDTICNRTCDLPTCSAVPQPTAPPRTPPFLLPWPIKFLWNNFFIFHILSVKSTKCLWTTDGRYLALSNFSLKFSANYLWKIKRLVFRSDVID